ncbi:MAG: diphthine synthase [Thermoprotei archaeon]|nr:MAG: diphthine synthase [Thermoprotei archaeon]
MGELVFVGLGLAGDGDLSLRAIEVLRRADFVYVELYTSLLPELDLSRLEGLVGKRVVRLRRSDLEDGEEAILRRAERGTVAILVPGDPFVATTHVAVRLEAIKRGIRTRVIHAPSIVSAVCGATGLQSYKFGRSVTVVYPEPALGYFPETPYDVLYDNLKRGLHTLLLLDLRVEEGKCMTVREAIEVLSAIEDRKGLGIVGDDTLAVGLARVGCSTELVRGAPLPELARIDFGPPPHSLVVPGHLHPMEAEALRLLAGVSAKAIERWERVVGELRGREGEEVHQGH